MLNRLTEVRLHVVVYLGYLPYLIGQDEKAQCHCTVKALHAHKVENCNKWFIYLFCMRIYAYRLYSLGYLSCALMVITLTLHLLYLPTLVTVLKCLKEWHNCHIYITKLA